MVLLAGASAPGVQVCYARKKQLTQGGVALMHAPWLGSRKVAFVPVLDAKVDTNPPADFRDRVFQRVFFDPHPTTNIDRSLQRYIQTVSYGHATLAPTVVDVVTSPDEDTVGAGLRSLPSDHDFDAACIVVPSGGPHRTGFAWWDAQAVNGFENFARVNLEESLGVWAMEVMHCLTEFGDLYNSEPHLQGFDNMACSCGTHPSTHTKVELQWLSPSAVATTTGFNEETFDLHAIGLPQPPPPGRWMAVRIPAPAGNNYFMVEARLRGDQYESATYASSGIPSEGVIVYEVAGKLEVYLRTPTALVDGDSFSNDVMEVRVTRQRFGGFQVTVKPRLGPNKRRVPFVRFLPASVAAGVVQNADLKPKFTGAAQTGQSYVFTQSPAPGAIVDVDTTVTLQLRDGPLP
jgi:hypothetical protein